MTKIAITGNIASGKSAVEEILRQKGYKVLDSDAVGHAKLSLMTKRCSKSLILFFIRKFAKKLKNF